MAFPAIRSSLPSGTTNSTGGAAVSGDSAATSHSVTLPATIAAGDLLLIWGRVMTDSSAVAISGGGWTIVQNTGGVGNDDIVFYAYRDTLADGTEDNSTITVTHASAKMAAISMAISGAAAPGTQAPQASTIALGTSQFPDATSVTPTGGAKDYLFLSLYAMTGESASVSITGQPTNYTSIAHADSGIAGAGSTNGCCRAAYRQLNASSEDPGSWDFGGSNNWEAYCLAIHPQTAQQFNQAMTATMPAATASVVKKTGKILTDTMPATTASVVRQTGKKVTATAPSSASIVKRTAKAVTATATSTASIITAKLKALALTATAPATASITRRTNKVLSATSPAVASVVKSMGKALNATATSTASIVRGIGKVLSATATSTASVVKALAHALTATATSTASIAAEFVSGGGAVFNQALTATATSTASITRQIVRALSATATVTSTASIARQIGKTLSATATSSASIVKQVAKTLSATATSTASIARQISRALTLNATVTSAASIAKRVGKTLSAAVTSTASMIAVRGARTIDQALTATVTSTASVTKRISKALTAAVSSVASFVADLIVPPVTFRVGLGPEVFPPGTEVKAYHAGEVEQWIRYVRSDRFNQPEPPATPVETQIAAADGIATFTALTRDEPYYFVARIPGPYPGTEVGRWGQGARGTREEWAVRGVGTP